MARKKTITLSVTRFVTLAYIIRLLSGLSAIEIINQLRAGNMKDTMFDLAIGVFERLEADGISIAIEGAFVTFVMDWIKKTARSKQLIRLGPLRITV